MIGKALEEISENDLRALITDGVVEKKTLEYKGSPPGATDSEKSKFCAHVCSFTNASGGDLIIGMQERNGVPVDLNGIPADELDAERRRLEHVIINGLEPRVPFHMHPVTLEDGSSILVCRIERSWIGPHRVRNSHKFYGRNSGGRYELDVGELRASFNLAETVPQRVRDFRAERIAALFADEAPVPLDDGAIMMLHVVPLASMAGSATFNIDPYLDHSTVIPTLGGGTNINLNLEGIVYYEGAGSGANRYYAQLYRNGIIESVIVFPPDEQGLFIPQPYYEEGIISVMGEYLPSLQTGGVPPPYYVLLSFLRVRGCRLGVDIRMMVRDSTLSRDSLILPEVAIENHGADCGRALRGTFDMVWNAFGLRRSPHYDADGNRVKPLW